MKQQHIKGSSSPLTIAFETHQERRRITTVAHPVDRLQKINYRSNEWCLSPCVRLSAKVNKNAEKFLDDPVAFQFAVHFNCQETGRRDKSSSVHKWHHWWHVYDDALTELPYRIGLHMKNCNASSASACLNSLETHKHTHSHA